MRHSVRSLYPFTLLEGQGMGTAYEYYSKLRTMHRVFERTGPPRSLAVVGLPEKHGYDLDFALLADELGCPLVVCEDRAEVLEGFETALGQLKDRGMRTRVAIQHITSLIDWSALDGARFDWVISTAAVQRLSDPQIATYAQNARRAADHLFCFVPNSGNRAHLTLSGLRGLILDQMLSLFGECGEILDSGYCDIPPFPPGLARSEEAKERAMRSPVEAWVMWGLQWWCRGEAVIPGFLKARLAHLVYVALDLRGTRA